MRKNLLILSMSGFLAFTTACGDKTDASSMSGNYNNNSSVVVEKVEPPKVIGVDKASVDKMLDNLKANNPQMKLNGVVVEKSPIQGYYQMQVDGDVLYVSPDGNTMIVGDVINTKNQVNLTEDVRKSARLALVNSIPESDMVVYTPKNGKYDHTITVFTDTSCGYCRKLHREMDDYLAKGIKVRYAAFPRAGKDSETYNVMGTVWCAKDKQKAMNDAKLGNDFKADKKLCKKAQAIDRELEIVRKLGLRGTPALIFDDGTLWPGYMPADRLKTVLDNNSKQNNSALGSGSNSKSKAS